MTVASGAVTSGEGPRRFTLAIDPGNRESAYCLIETGTCQPSVFGKIPNQDLVLLLRDEAWDWTRVGRFNRRASLAVEMVSSYGMPVGAEVFETCVWVGRFVQVLRDQTGVEADLVKRKPVVRHHCGTDQAKDSNVRQALTDRFAPGVRNFGKGTKAEPGWFYGFAADIWAAYALAVYHADKEEGR